MVRKVIECNKVFYSALLLGSLFPDRHYELPPYSSENMASFLKSSMGPEDNKWENK